MNYYIVSGTTKGLGKAIKNTLLKDSENYVFTLNRSKETTNSPLHLNIPCDISDNKQIEAAFQQINDKIDSTKAQKLVLINNAAVTDPIKFIHKADTKQIESCFAINVLGLIQTCKQFINSFLEEEFEKVIVNISSGASYKPMAGLSIYTATKAAVEIFTKSVALEQDIQTSPTTVFAFQPGMVETPMQKYVRNKKKEDLPIVDIFKDSYKNKENYSPEFVASMLLRLINEGGKSGSVYKAREVAEDFNMN